MEWDEIGSRIKRVREAQGLTQTDLASRIKKTESSVRKYESGLTEVPLNVLFSIARQLDTSLSYLLSGEHQSTLLEEGEALLRAAKAADDVYLLRIIIKSLAEKGLSVAEDQNKGTLTISQGGKSWVAEQSELIELFNETFELFIQRIIDTVNRPKK